MEWKGLVSSIPTQNTDSRANTRPLIHLYVHTHAHTQQARAHMHTHTHAHTSVVLVTVGNIVLVLA